MRARRLPALPLLVFHLLLGGHAARSPLGRHAAAAPPPPVLAGAHYFGGWFHCAPGDRCLTDHFHGKQPTGAPTDDWFPYYASRTPLLGNLTVGLITEAAVAAEVRAADTALDFFDVLYYGGGADCGIPSSGDPNLRYCLDTTLAWLLNSTSVWNGTQRLHFFITISNDIDAYLKTSLVGAAGEATWLRMVATFTHAMAHPRYLHVGGRPVFSILSADEFLRECGGNGTLVNYRLSQLKSAARAAGLQEPIVGNSASNPMSSVGVPSWEHTHKHPAGYIEWDQTKVGCPGGCTIKTVQVSSLAQCQALCNTTASCQAVTVNRGTPSTTCELLTVTAPGTNDPAHDTYTRVPPQIDWDWTGTYGGVPVCRPAPGSDPSDWTCPEYRNSWWPNASSSGAKVFPYTQLGDWNTVSRTNHSHDLVPYVPCSQSPPPPRPPQSLSQPFFKVTNCNCWSEQIPSEPDGGLGPAALGRARAIIRYAYRGGVGGRGEGCGGAEPGPEESLRLARRHGAWRFPTRL
jgi:hypothetical protein